MDRARLGYLLLVVFIVSAHPLLSQEAVERPTAGHSPAVLFLSQYIQIPSVTGAENEAGKFLAEASMNLGLHVQLLTEGPGSYNFAASLYPLSLGKPNVIFLTHIDVVPEGDHNLWTYPPFSGTIADDQVWGRGAFDNKGHGAMQLFALAAFVREAASRELPYNFTMLAVSNEETDGTLGAGLVTENYLELLSPVVVYGEGGIGCAGIVASQPELVMFGIEVAQKRALWLKMEASGAAFGHGSAPSAIYPSRELTLATHALLNGKNKPVLSPLVTSMLYEIGCYEKGIRRLALKNFRLLSPLIHKVVCQEELINALLHNTITLTGIGSSEGAYNQVPHSAWATFDIRLLPGTSPDEFLKILQKRVKSYDVKIQVIKETPYSPESQTGFFYKALEQAIHENFSGVSVTPMLMPATNDNLYFRAKGIPSYGLVPGIFKIEHVQSIHNVDERIPITALEEGIAVYTSLIRYLSIRQIASE